MNKINLFFSQFLFSWLPGLTVQLGYLQVQARIFQIIHVFIIIIIGFFFFVIHLILLLIFG